MRIPEIADELILLAEEHDIPRLFQLALMLRRRRNQKYAPPTSTPFTHELVMAIREYVAAHPGVKQSDVAIQFNVNIGRISEALHGRRK